VGRLEQEHGAVDGFVPNGRGSTGVPALHALLAADGVALVPDLLERGEEFVVGVDAGAGFLRDRLGQDFALQFFVEISQYRATGGPGAQDRVTMRTSRGA
jgi:lipid-binding SYLF domain-containing protein